MEFIGVFLVFVGLISFVDVLNLFNLGWDVLWPVLIIALGLYYCIRDKRINFLSGAALIFGGWFLLEELGILSANIVQIAWPIVLILLGLLLVMKNSRTGNYSNISNEKDIGYKNVQYGKINQLGKIEYVSIFNSIKEKVSTECFKGAELSSTFGSLLLDLTNIKPDAKEVKVEATSVFGGMKLIVSDKYNVQIRPTAIFGSVNHTIDYEYDSGKDTVVIYATSVFGSIDIISKVVK